MKVAIAISVSSRLYLGGGVHWRKVLGVPTGLLLNSAIVKGVHRTIRSISLIRRKSAWCSSMADWFADGWGVPLEDRAMDHFLPARLRWRVYPGAADGTGHSVSSISTSTGAQDSQSAGSGTTATECGSAHSLPHAPHRTA